MDSLDDTRNSKTLASFIAYCHEHPQERFWQALRNWADAGNWVVVSDDMDVLKHGRDTFFWGGRNSRDG